MLNLRFSVDKDSDSEALLLSADRTQQLTAQLSGGKQH
jgi:hypothetical protein